MYLSVQPFSGFLLFLLVMFSKATVNTELFYSLFLRVWLFKISHEILCRICLSLSDLSHLAKCPQHPSTLLQMAGFSCFFWPNNIPLYVYHIVFIHLCADGPLGCFLLLVIVNNTAIHVGMQIYFQYPVFTSFGYMPTGGLAGSHGRSIL